MFQLKKGGDVSLSQCYFGTIVLEDNSCYSLIKKENKETASSGLTVMASGVVPCVRKCADQI